MSHFNFENELNSVLRMDGPITKGPGMRFERKAECNQSVNSSLNISTTAKTPMKNLNRSVNNPKTPSNAKTPKSSSNAYNLINNDHSRYYKLIIFLCYISFYFMHIMIFYVSFQQHNTISYLTRYLCFNKDMIRNCPIHVCFNLIFKIKQGHREDQKLQKHQVVETDSFQIVVLHSLIQDILKSPQTVLIVGKQTIC